MRKKAFNTFLLHKSPFSKKPLRLRQEKFFTKMKPKNYKDKEM